MINSKSIGDIITILMLIISISVSISIDSKIKHQEKVLTEYLEYVKWEQEFKAINNSSIAWELNDSISHE